MYLRMTLIFAATLTSLSAGILTNADSSVSGIDGCNHNGNQTGAGLMMYSDSSCTGAMNTFYAALDAENFGDMALSISSSATQSASADISGMGSITDHFQVTGATGIGVVIFSYALSGIGVTDGPSSLTQLFDVLVDGQPMVSFSCTGEQGYDCTGNTFTVVEPVTFGEQVDYKQDLYMFSAAGRGASASGTMNVTMADIKVQDGSGNTIDGASVSWAPVRFTPEASTWALMGISMLALGIRRKLTA